MNEFIYADTGSWEDWMKEYRYGALYILPPKKVMDAVDSLRRQYDPKSHAISNAHISLSEPFPSMVDGNQINELGSILSKFKPFEIKFGPLTSFLPHPGVVYDINPKDIIKDLKSRIHATQIFKNSTTKHMHIPPHMTIAEFISQDRTIELLEKLNSELPQGMFVCDAIHYLIPNRRFYFETVLTMPLGT